MSNDKFRSSSPDLDAQLKAYLDQQQRDKDEGNTIAALRSDVYNVRLEVGEFSRELREVAAEQRIHRIRIDRHGRDIRDIKAHIFNREPEEFDTGVHQVEDLRKHLAEREAELKERKKKEEADETWWKRQKVQWAGALVGATVATAFGGVGTVLWYLLIHSTK